MHISQNHINKLLHLSILIFLLTHSTTLVNAKPIPVYGKIEYLDGLAVVNAKINVSSEYGYISTETGFDGYFQVNLGDPLNWPENTKVDIFVIKTRSQSLYTGSTSFYISSSSTNIGIIQIEEDKNFSKNNNSPIAIINSNGFVEGTIGIDTYFDASESYDVDGKIIEYRWDFDGDGKFDTDWSEQYDTTYNFSEPNIYSTILEVKDDENNTDKAVAIVDISPVEEVIKIVVTKYMNQNLKHGFSFEKLQSFAIKNITWLVDGLPASYSEEFDYDFKSEGNHIISLYIIDEKDNQYHDVSIVNIKNSSQTNNDNNQNTPDFTIASLTLSFIILFYVFKKKY